MFDFTVTVMVMNFMYNVLAVYLLNEIDYDSFVVLGYLLDVIS